MLSRPGLLSEVWSWIKIFVLLHWSTFYSVWIKLAIEQFYIHSTTEWNQNITHSFLSALLAGAPAEKHKKNIFHQWLYPNYPAPSSAASSILGQHSVWSVDKVFIKNSHFTGNILLTTNTLHLHVSSQSSLFILTDHKPELSTCLTYRPRAMSRPWHSCPVCNNADVNTSLNLLSEHLKSISEDKILTSSK